MPQLSEDRILPRGITNLRMATALRHCGSTSVEEAFDKSKAQTLYVYDRPEDRYSDWTDSEPDNVSKCFIAENPNGIELALLPLDNKIVTGPKITCQGICDCLILTEAELSFVEFKTNVESNSYLNFLDKAADAIAQLWHTYSGIIKPKCCKALRKVELPVEVDFYVVFDKDLKITGVSSELMDRQNDFLEDTGLPLFFDNAKIFK